MFDCLQSQTNVISLDIAFDVSFQARPIIFPTDQLSYLVNAKMPCKKIIMVMTYHLGADDLWDIWEPSVLEHSFDFFSALQKACRVSEKLCFLVVFLQLGESQSHTSNVSVRTFKSYFVLKKVLKLAQLGKDSRSAYKDLVEKRRLTRLACQKARYSGQRGM